MYIYAQLMVTQFIQLCVYFLWPLLFLFYFGSMTASETVTYQHTEVKLE